MNIGLVNHEWLVLGLGLLVLLVDLWLAPAARRKLGYVAAAGLLAILIYSLAAFHVEPGQTQYAFGQMYALDGLALFFKRFFLIATILVLLMSVEFADRLEPAIGEYYALVLFALAGMLFASSANHFALLFVSLELITITFYVLTSFERSRLTSLEAGLKYLIIGALSTSFTVFGIALVYGTSTKLGFTDLAGVLATQPDLVTNRILQLGLLLVMVGLGFKIAAFPFQIWAPDVYQGAPSPTTAFLAVGSKAAGFVLLLRLLFIAVPDVTAHWAKLLIVISAITILYGNLCAIPQRNVKRLMGYSSMAHAGYMLLGIAAMATALSSPRAVSAGGASAVLYYLSGYLFTVLGAFLVICLVLQQVETEDISGLAGLSKRAPLLAATMTVAMVSLAGIPPLAGFFGKFLLFRAALAQAPFEPAYYWLVALALVGVVISMYYYFGVVRAMFWSQALAPVPINAPSITGRFSLYACVAGILVLGIYPNWLVNVAEAAVKVLR
ncbi:MAG TPA: NADH-quinone oxidoreductase subunit N [Verrucomicrobiae bacterium]|nr:NADH-quinone oxidoreductase subunit N [Verrucomicrobiae bacterium]